MRKICAYLYCLTFLFCIYSSSFLVAGDQRQLDVQVLLDKIQEYQSPDSWAFKNISSELMQFSLSDLSVDRMWDVFYNEFSDPTHLMCLVCIKDNVPTIKVSERRKINERELIILTALRSLCNVVKIPDVTFLFSSHDSFDNDRYPILTFSKKKYSKNLLMPDFEALEGYGNLRSQIQISSRIYPWNVKINKLFWRGATTGGAFTVDNYKNFPRSLAVLYSLRRPDLMDAKFTAVVQDGPGVHDLLQQNKMLGNFVSTGKSLRYKYLVDIDGNASTYSRCFWILLSNSVLFKVDSDYVQWYYDLFEENHNYVKLQPDLSDLEEKVHWMRSNDKIARQISMNGSILAEEHLSHEAVFAYLFNTLKFFAAMQ